MNSPSPETQDFFQAVQDSFASGSLISLVLSNPVRKGDDLAKKQSVRPVVIRGRSLFQWELQFQKQQTHLNLDDVQSMGRLSELFGPVYRDANLFTSEADVIARSTSKGMQIRRQKPSRTRPATVPFHNRQKEYLIPEGVPCPFLVELDVMAPTGQVKQSRQKKFRQINRYLELVNDLYEELPATGTLRVVDFGCGLSYLTFALHHLLTVVHHRQVDFLGIDQNEHVISRCRQIAEKLNSVGLRFSSGKIKEQKQEKSKDAPGLDLAVSLHACDTATDHALADAVGRGAQVILAAPCCQHELSTRIQSDPFRQILQHGILKERLSAIATDALRASALEGAGYRAQIVEFIDLEHTPKNLLIRAVRRTPGTQSEEIRTAAREKYQHFKAEFGVDMLATDLIFDAIPETDESPA